MLDEGRERPQQYPLNTDFDERQSRPHKRRKSRGDGIETKGLSDKIHSLRRLLEKATDMPADARQEKERELQGYLADQQRRKATREKNALTSRYHFVRFMERKKAQRRLQQLRRKFDELMATTSTAPVVGVAPSPPDRGPRNVGQGTVNGVDGHQFSFSAERLPLEQEDYKRQLHEAEVDLNYTLYAPLHQKYISLYPSSPKKSKCQATNDGGKQAGQEHAAVTNDEEAGIFRNGSGQKPPLWYEVEKAMTNDTLEALRDGEVLTADNSIPNSLTFRSVGEPAKGKADPGTELDSSDEDGNTHREEDFFER